jgi:hypothetical protein
MYQFLGITPQDSQVAWGRCNMEESPKLETIVPSGMVGCKKTKHKLLAGLHPQVFACPSTASLIRCPNI